MFTKDSWNAVSAFQFIYGMYLEVLHITHCGSQKLTNANVKVRRQINDTKSHIWLHQNTLEERNLAGKENVIYDERNETSHMSLFALNLWLTVARGAHADGGDSAVL